MKFVKRAAAIAVTALLVIAAGATAANADQTSHGFVVSGEIPFPATKSSGVALESFSATPYAQGVTVSVSVKGHAYADGALHLGVYYGADQGDLSSESLDDLGTGLVPSDVLDKVSNFSDLAFSGTYTFGSEPVVSEEFEISFDPEGAYSVVLFAEHKPDRGKREVYALAGAQIGVSEATPEKPTAIEGENKITIPASDKFTYQANGLVVGDGDLDITADTKVSAFPNPGYVLAPGAEADWSYAYVAPTNPGNGTGTTTGTGTGTGTKPETGTGSGDEKTPGKGTTTTPKPDSGKETNSSKASNTDEEKSAPAVPNEDQLSPALEGKITAQATAAAGAQVKMFVGTQYAGQEVSVYVFSDPVFLGKHLVDNDGYVTVTLPEGLTGSHRLAAYKGDELIGWNRILIDDPSGTGFVAGTVTTEGQAQAQPQTQLLANTGSEASGFLGLLAFGSVAVGVASLLTGRRTRRSEA